MPEYTCKQCKFSTKLRSNYLRHLDTNKHLKRIKAQTIEVKKNTVNYVSDNKTTRFYGPYHNGTKYGWNKRRTILLWFHL